MVWREVEVRCRLGFRFPNARYSKSSHPSMPTWHAIEHILDYAKGFPLQLGNRYGFNWSGRRETRDLEGAKLICWREIIVT